MRVIIPMAGHGKRFADAGYTEEKALIKVHDLTLLDWARQCIPDTWDQIYVVRSEQQKLLEYLQNQLYWGPGHRQILALPGSTRGQAASVLSAVLAVPPKEPVATMNCDQWINCDLKGYHEEALAKGWDGFILCFDGEGTAWSYAQCKPESQEVTWVVEKPKETPPGRQATAGFYWWRTAELMIECICRMIANHDFVNGEPYLAPAYNYAILSGARIVALPCEFRGLGTPELVKVFAEGVLVEEP